MAGRIFRLRVGEYPALSLLNILAPSTLVHLVSSLDIMLIFFADDSQRGQFLQRPKYQVHRRREAVRSGRLARPTLSRSVSESAAKTWPGATRSRSSRRVSRWDIHSELEDLVIASTRADSDDDNDEYARDNESDESREDQVKFHLDHLNDGWQRKGTRELQRERRAKSEGTAPSPESV